MKLVTIAALGFALVVGVVAGGMVGNPFGRSAPTSAAGVGGRLISLGTQTVGAGQTADFPLVETIDCQRVVVMAKAAADEGITVDRNVRISPDGTQEFTKYTVLNTQLEGTVNYQYMGISVSNPGWTTDVTAWIWCVFNPTYPLGGRLISLGTQTVGNGGSTLFPLVETSDCSRVVAMVKGGEGGEISLDGTVFISPDGTQLFEWGGVLSGLGTHTQATGEGAVNYPYMAIRVWNNGPEAYPTDVTAWLWCVTSPTYAVGGIAELPALAGTGGSGMGGTTYVVLAGAAAGVLAFGVLATLSVKKRGVR